MRKPLFLYVAVLLFVMPLFAIESLTVQFACPRGPSSNSMDLGCVDKKNECSLNQIMINNLAFKKGTIIDNTENDNAPIPLEWEAESIPWEGTDGRVLYAKSALHISFFNKGETQINGTIEFWFFDLNGEFVTYGEESFQGYYYEETRYISINADNWITDPAYDRYYFYLCSFDCYLSKDLQEMDYWYKAKYPVDKDEEYDSGFEIKRDNNHFRNSEGSFFGLIKWIFGKPTYRLSEKNGFYEKIFKLTNEDPIEMNRIQKKMDESWAGACYGIAATMGLIFEKRLTPYDISKEKVSSYYEMKYPEDNDYLRDALHYYNLSQHLSLFGEEALLDLISVNSKRYSNLRNINWNTANHVNLSSFLSGLTRAAKEATKNKNVLMLNYSCSKGGHSILVTKYSYKNQEYKLGLYDMNTRVLSSGKFIDMTINGSFTKFEFKDANGWKITEKDYQMIDYISPYKFVSISKKTNKERISGSGNYTYISFSRDSSFSLKSSNGYSLSYDKGVFSGDLPIFSINDADNSVNLKTSYCSSVEIDPKRKKIEIDIYDNDNFKSVGGQNIEFIDISMSGDIKLSGKTFSFKAFTTLDQMLNDKQKGMGSIYAKGKGEVIIHKGQDTIDVTSETTISHVETKIYQGVNVIEGKIKGKQNSVVVKPCEETIGTSSSIEDGMIIFSKQGYAYRGRPIKPFVSIYVGGKSLKKNKEFKVQYENNVEVGIGKLTVTGVGEYSGSLSAEFPIVPKKVKVKSVASYKSGFEIKWNSSGPKDGFEIQYDTDPDFKKAKTKKIEDPEGSSAQVEGLAVGTEYFVRIRAYKTEAETGITYNSNWSDVKSVLIYPN